MRQYEVWWAALPEPIGSRLVLLLSRTPAYEYLSKIIVAEITTQIRGIPQELALHRKEGLPRKSVANFDNIHVIPKSLLSERAGAVPPLRENEIKRALGYALGWSELKLL